MQQTSRRHIFITGCTTGIGRACALHLARGGFSVIASGRQQADVDEIERQASGLGTNLRALRMDVTDSESIQVGARRIRELVGSNGLYGLINNAGICAVGPVECVSLEGWREQFEVNLFGTIAVTQAMLPLLRGYRPDKESGSARIANINSICGEAATPVFGAYSASKFALRAMSDCLRLELRERKIHVCSIFPGTIQSEIWRKEKEGMHAIAAQPLACEIYSRLIRNVSDYVFKCADTAIPAQHVAEALMRCMQSRVPKQRYRIGWEAHVGSWARRLMPDRLFYFLMGRTLSVPCASSNSR